MGKRRLYAILVIMWSGFARSAEIESPEWIGIVGDSTTTGALAHPSYAPQYSRFLGQILRFSLESRRTTLTPKLEHYHAPEDFGILESPVSRMTRILYSMEEFRTRKSPTQLNLEAKASLKVDTPEYSFGYMVGRGLGIPADKIVLAGQDGKRIRTLAQQLARFREVSPTLPPLVLVSYAANDYCSPSNFDLSLKDFRKKYSDYLSTEFDKIQKMVTEDSGTRILFLAPLDVSQLLTNKNLLTQEIPFTGGPITCSDLREGLPNRTGKLAKRMAEILDGECRAILKPVDDPQTRFAKLLKIQAVQMDALEDAAQKFNKLGTNIKVDVAKSTKTIQYQPGDLANDCFHPGIGAHERIANTLLKNELAH